MNWFMGQNALYFSAKELNLTLQTNILMPDDLSEYEKRIGMSCKREWVLLEDIAWTLQPDMVYPLIFNGKPWSQEWNEIQKDSERLQSFETLKTIASYYSLQLGLFAELLQGGCLVSMEVCFSFNDLHNALY